MELLVPDPSLVVLIGPSGSGKSTFAARHFRATEIISSDHARALVSDDENDQAATPAAFRILYAIARERLRARRLAVIDATNVRPESRKPLIQVARKRDLPAVAIAFDLPEGTCQERNRSRTHRTLPSDVVRQQCAEMSRSMPGLPNEGFYCVYVLDSADAVEAAKVIRRP